MDASRYIVERPEPAYLRLSRAELDRRIQRGLEELRNCRACPRDCGVNRLVGETHMCNTGRHAIVSSAFPHFGEEDCLRGTRGSGTIFFGLCNLRCVFCQNWDISQQRNGREMKGTEIARLMLELQGQGCHNINFVTPEHVVPQVLEAVVEAIDRGLRVPIVYNTSAYDSLASLRLMDGIVDIYMPDFKFWTRDSSKRLVKAKDYPQRAREAILEMHRQVGPLCFDGDGLAVRGLLVRHLVMPAQEDEAESIWHWLAREVSPDTYVNIMDQYSPDHEVGKKNMRGLPMYDDIGRSTRQAEMRSVRERAQAAGLWRFDQRRTW